MNLLDDSLTYDARGKLRRALVTSASVDVNTQTIETHYSGLGAVVASSKRTPGNYQWETEEFRTSAVGTVYWSHTAKGSAVDRQPQFTRFGHNGEVKSKSAMPPALQPFYMDALKNEYDVAGNTTHSTAQFNGEGAEWFYSATRSYYSSDNRLAVAQRYNVTSGGRSGAWEEFRYDALGHRVLSRTRRPSGPDGYVALCDNNCNQWIERTIWDGDNALYEMRVNVSDTSTSSEMDALYSSGLNWGLVGYVHAGGYDRPVFTMDGRVPTYNWRGLPESSVWTYGGRADCSLGGAGCTTVSWPSANGIYLKPSPFGGWQPPSSQWIGSVLADGVGSSGMLYRRNRYYDPASGQFTQQDPIGLAGGLNLYGYANGDPINFSDPFGLCPLCPLAYAGAEGGAVVGTAILPGPGTVIGGVIGAGLGTIGGILFGKWLSGKLSSEEAVPLPDGLTGTEPRVRPGRVNTTGTGNPEEKFGELTGGNSTTGPDGTRVGTNGVRLRPGTATKGPRIDIPAKGDRKHETVHYPPPNP